MYNQLQRKDTKLNWLSKPYITSNKIALIIPQFNENSNMNFRQRLDYYEQIACDFKEEIDVIIIDDGSTDDSLTELHSFLLEDSRRLFVASVTPNANKVGAIFMTILAIESEHVILSDFDTDLIGFGRIIDTIKKIDNCNEMMGFYFRMEPFEGSGYTFWFQRFEYSLARSLYRFFEKEKSVPVMPGAGSCYKRKVLTSIYEVHSGLRSGEDREATVIGLKLGYKTLYEDKVFTLTRPPIRFSKLVKQRIRWNVGYYETIQKEKKFYRRQIFQASQFGIRSALEIFYIFFIIFFPVLIITLGIYSTDYIYYFLLIFYTMSCLWNIRLIRLAREEFDLKDKKFYLLFLLYPFFKTTLDYCAWMGTLKQIIRYKNKQI